MRVDRTPYGRVPGRPSRLVAGAFRWILTRCCTAACLMRKQRGQLGSQ